MNIALLSIDSDYPNQIIPPCHILLPRWVDRKELFKSTDFKDYRPREGFYCREYFSNSNK